MVQHQRKSLVSLKWQLPMPETTPAQEIGFGEAIGLVMSSLTRATIGIAGVAEGAARPLQRAVNIADNYGQLGENTSASHLRVGIYKDMGNEAKNIERLKTRFPHMDWDTILKDKLK